MLKYSHFLNQNNIGFGILIYHFITKNIEFSHFVYFQDLFETKKTDT